MSPSRSHAYLSQYSAAVERIAAKAVSKLEPVSQQFHANQIVSPSDLHMSSARNSFCCSVAVFSHLAIKVILQ